MLIVHVRNVPPELYKRIQDQAAAENRSFSAQVIVLLQTAVQSVQHRRAKVEILDDIRRRRLKQPERMPDSTTLLRQDRDDRDR